MHTMIFCAFKTLLAINFKSLNYRNNNTHLVCKSKTNAFFDKCSSSRTVFFIFAFHAKCHISYIGYFLCRQNLCRTTVYSNMKNICSNQNFVLHQVQSKVVEIPTTKTSSKVKLCSVVIDTLVGGMVSQAEVASLMRLRSGLACARQGRQLTELREWVLRVW